MLGIVRPKEGPRSIRFVSGDYGNRRNPPRQSPLRESLLFRHGCADSRHGISGVRAQLLSGRCVQSSAAQPNRSHPRRGVFLVDPFADRANLAGRRRPHRSASPPQLSAKATGAPSYRSTEAAALGHFDSSHQAITPGPQGKAEPPTGLSDSCFELRSFSFELADCCKNIRDPHEDSGLMTEWCA
jgi:hypothetical protein